MSRRHVWIVLCTSAMTLIVAALARAPYTPPGAEEAMLRFSWRLSVPANENCRPRTQAELDALPAHMRTAEVCTRDEAAYSLVTRIDEAAPDTVQLLRGGLKGDRPLFVLREHALPPGRRRIRVELRREVPSSASTLLAGLDTVVELVPGRVQLVTLDAEARRFLVRSSAPE